MSIVERLKKAGTNDQKQDAYKKVLQDLFKEANEDGLIEFVNHLMSEEVSTIISRPILKEFALQVSQVQNVDLHKNLAIRSLQIIQPRVVGFEEQVHIIRSKLSDLYLDESDFIEAAKVLRGIPIDSSQWVMSDEDKAALYVKISQLYLEENEWVEAEQFINKASLINIRDKTVSLRYKSSFTRVLDFKKKFLEASLQYYHLSHLVPEKDRDEVLEHGVICAILAHAGPQRSRILSTFYKDDRTSKLQVYPILEKMFMERIIKSEEKKKIQRNLKSSSTRKGRRMDSIGQSNNRT